MTDLIILAIIIVPVVWLYCKSLNAIAQYDDSRPSGVSTDDPGP